MTRPFKLGRRRPIARGPRLHLRNYLLQSLPTPPDTIDYSAPAASYLSQILGNDELGDCTAAGAFHIGGLLLANAGAPVPFTEDDVVKFYSATTGYVPGDASTDQGGDEVTVLNYWQENGLTPSAHKIAGWASIDATNAAEVRTALWLFENLYFGVELPDAWLAPMPNSSGFTWDVAGKANPDNGHCFAGVGYDASGVKIDTWGMLGTITWPAIAAYAATKKAGELYAVLGPDAIASASAKAPNGFDWSQLTADLDSIKS